MNLIQQIEQELTASTDRTLPDIGDTVRVHVRIQEGDKSRVQVFEGTVIAHHKGGPRTTFTVRKISFSVGVERIFPLYSPFIEEIETKSHHKVRRAKLYYLRGLQGKKARLKEVRIGTGAAGAAGGEKRTRRVRR